MHLKHVYKMYYLAVKNETMLEPVFGNVISIHYFDRVMYCQCIVSVFLNKL